MRRFGTSIGLLLPLSLGAQGLPAAATVSRVADSLAQAFIAARGAPSVAIALVRGRDTITMRAWGKADLEQDVAATPRTVYLIGSVTKQFTSSAIMRLVEHWECFNLPLARDVCSVLGEHLLDKVAVVT